LLLTGGASNVNEFLQICLNVIDLMLQILNLIMDHWYLLLLFVAGLIWLGFDIWEQLTNIDFEDKERWRK